MEDRFQHMSTEMETKLKALAGLTDTDGIDIRLLLVSGGRSLPLQARYVRRCGGVSARAVRSSVPKRSATPSWRRHGMATSACGRSWPHSRQPH
jgi:hypothetical protein